MHPATRSGRTLWRLVIAMLLTPVAALFAVLGPYESIDGTGPWAATGFCFLILALTPRAWRVLGSALLFVILTIALISFGSELRASATAALAMSLSGLLISYLMAPIPGRYLVQISALARFTMGGLLAAVLIGGIAAGFSLLTPHQLGSSFVAAAASALASILLLGPLVLTKHHPATRPVRIEVGIQATLVGLALIAAFLYPELGPLQWVPIALVIWGSFRFSEQIIAIELATIYLGATFLISISNNAETETHWYAELYLLLMFTICMPVAMASRERNDALHDMLLTSQVFKSSYRNSQMPIALTRWINSELVIEDINAAGQRLFDTNWEQLIGRPVSSVLILPEDISAIAAAINSGTRSGWEGRAHLVATPDSALSIILSRLDSAGPAPQLSLTIHDLTAEARVLAQLEEERNYNAAVLGSSSSVIMVTKTDGTIVSCNQAGCDIVGYSEAELIGRKYYDIAAPPELRDELKDAFQKNIHAPDNDETVVMTKTGERRLFTYRQSDLVSSTTGEKLEVYTALDITEQRQASNLSQQLLDSASTVAFIGTDLDGRVTLFNSGAETLLGQSARTAIGTDFIRFLSPAALAGYAATNDPTFGDVVSHVAKDGVPETRDWTWVRASGAALRVSMTTSVVLDPFGHLPTGYLFVARDVSDARRSQEIVVLALKREREAVNRLRSLDRVKDEFISTVSHELRTPMTSIIGTTEMLEDEMGGPLTDGQRSMLDIISRNGERLLTLADDLLLTAKLHSRKEPQQEDQVDLRDVVGESLESMGMTLNGRAIDLNTDLPTTPIMVNGSHFHLERAISNLLSNAIKFTVDGGTVSVHLSRTSSEAILQITDDGIGIPSDDLENVFDRFFRSANAEEHAIQGTGLGLAIVKAIVESHRGSIAVTSEVDRGTTVRINLPLANGLVPTQPSPRSQRS
ncbi:MAG TPA: PAS domain-containing sensor histidine kinase [Marmoricola sp.]|nr:PAS domain-containing sensor histidine kinase [Marmoricola sp.]HNI69818.1 PAS domain-containing sensor histidine kinase [Marmoricola sp.]HNO38919.1 PAS domain-containing sensor histidine kinase [Marmoricola sp.]